MKEGTYMSNNNYITQILNLKDKNIFFIVKIKMDRKILMSGVKKRHMKNIKIVNKSFEFIES